MKTQNDKTFISFFLSHIVEYLVWIFSFFVIGFAIFLSGLARAYHSDNFEFKFIGMTILLLFALIVYLFERIIREYRYFKFKESIVVEKNIALTELKVEIVFSKTLIPLNNGKYPTKEFDKTLKAEIGYHDNKVFIFPFVSKKIDHFLKPIIISDTISRLPYVLRMKKTDETESQETFWLKRNSENIEKIIINKKSYKP